MKRIFRFLFFLVVLLLASAFILPIVFKDSIVERIKQEANANLNAKLDFEDVDVSLISTFPYFGFSMEGMRITGIEEFEGQELVSVEDFGLSIDLMSVISGDRYSVEKINVQGVNLHILILEDGSANFDIAKVDSSAEESVESTETGSAFSVALKGWKFSDVNLRYEDRQGNIDFKMQGLEHSGSGDLSENIVDLQTQTEAQSMDFVMDGVKYLNRVHLLSDFDMELNQEKFSFTFGENSVALNGLQLNFEGMLAMPDERISMDLRFSSPDNSFKSLISLIPAIYYQEFDQLETRGEFRLNGLVQGIYINDIYPSFNLNLMVREGFFKYPDLPSTVEDVNVDLEVVNKSRNLGNMLVNLSRMDAKIAGSEIHSTFRLQDPLNDPEFDFMARAQAKLEDILAVVPMNGYDLKGAIDMDLATSGRMSMIDNEQYEDLKASGYIKAAGLVFGGDSLGMDVEVFQSELSMSPQSAKLGPTVIKYEGQTMEMEGSLDNIIAYVLRGDLLKGEFDFYSPRLDLLALAGEESEAGSEETDAATDSSSESVVRLPQNIDFKLLAKVDSLLYDQIEIANLGGAITLNNGSANLENVKMDLLGGSLTINGAYNSTPPQPIADFDFMIRNFSFKESYESLDFVKQMAPVMQNMEGSYNMGLDMTTELGNDMSPDLNSVNASGVLNTRTVQVGGKVFSQLATFLNNPDYQNIGVSDVDLEFTIENGLIEVKPFDFKLAGQKAELGGNMSLAQDLDFNLTTDLPLSSLKADKYLSQFRSLSSGAIPMTVAIGGTATDPEVRPSLGDLKQQLTADIKEKINQVVDDAKTKVKEDVNAKLDQMVKAAEAQGDKLIAEARANGDRIKGEAKKQADRLRKEGEDAAQKILDEAGSNPLKKAAAKPLADRTRKEANEKAQKLEDEAAKQADDLVKAAEKQKQKLVEDARAKAQV